MGKSWSDFHLLRGAHVDADRTCLMEAVAQWTGERHSDHPTCVSPVLAEFGRHLNDLLADDQRQRLLPFVPLLAGTAGDNDADWERLALLKAWRQGRFPHPSDATADVTPPPGTSAPPPDPATVPVTAGWSWYFVRLRSQEAAVREAALRDLLDLFARLIAVGQERRMPDVWPPADLPEAVADWVQDVSTPGAP